MNATTTITGTPAQIKWASAIREKRQMELEAWFEKQEATLRTIDGIGGVNAQEIIDIVHSNCQELLQVQASRYWIDTRDMECYQMLNEQK